RKSRHTWAAGHMPAQVHERAGGAAATPISTDMIPTPYYLIDEAALLRNLHIIDHVRRHSGAKVLLALKCFASWSVFELMRQYMDGTTSSSLFEARLGHEKFGGETHAYSVAYSNQ